MFVGSVGVDDAIAMDRRHNSKKHIACAGKLEKDTGQKGIPQLLGTDRDR